MTGEGLGTVGVLTCCLQSLPSLPSPSSEASVTGNRLLWLPTRMPLRESGGVGGRDFLCVVLLVAATAAIAAAAAAAPAAAPSDAAATDAGAGAGAGAAIGGVCRGRAGAEMLRIRPIPLGLYEGMFV